VGKSEHAKSGVRLRCELSPSTRVICAPEIDAALTGRLTTPKTNASEQASFQMHPTEGSSYVAVPSTGLTSDERYINGPRDRVPARVLTAEQKAA
jgi:hypothetical protein